MADLGRIKAMVANENQAYFVKYFDGALWYKVTYEYGPDALYSGAPKWEFEFPVPISDVGTATFHPQEKALLLMRYIRKHMDLIEEGKNG